MCEKIKMLNEAIQKLDRLYKKVHENEQQPEEYDEKITQIVMETFKGFVMRKIIEDSNIQTLELSLFYFWQSLFIDLKGISNDSIAINDSLPVVVKLLLDISDTFSDEDQIPEMQEMSLIINMLKNEISGNGANHIPQEKVKQDVESVNTELVELINLFIGHNVNPDLIKNTLLYFWLRTSTIRNNVDESIFQRLERNWPQTIKIFEKEYMEHLEIEIC